MVQGLAFLSKKSWHTKNFANQEKVWLAEERQRSEEQKTKELARQIQQEREEEELEQIAGGGISRRKLDRGIDWMYQGGNPQSELAKEDAKKQSEEYLMGKEFSPGQQQPVGHFHAENTSEGIHAVLKKPPPDSSGSAATTIIPDSAAVAAAPVPEKQSSVQTVHERNEAFRMRLEDPMFAVAEREKEKQQKYQQKKELYERVTGGLAVDAVAGETSRKRERKTEEGRRLRKREKKEKRHKKKSRSDRDEPRRHRRSPSRSPDSRVSSDDHEDYKSRYSRSRRGRSPRRKRSQSPVDRRHRDRRSNSADSSGHSRHQSPCRDRRTICRRSPSYSSDDSRNRKRARFHTRSQENYHGGAEYDHSTSDCKPAANAPVSLKREGYGLQGGVGKAKHVSADLGPNRDLLEQKRRERDEERLRMRDQAYTRRHRTPEEREAALRAMEADAQRQEQLRRQRSARSNDDGHEPVNRAGASFIREVQQQAHGIRQDLSMTERLQRNRNTNQKLQNDDSFL